MMLVIQSSLLSCATVLIFGKTCCKYSITLSFVHVTPVLEKFSALKNATERVFIQLITEKKT